MCVVSGCLKKMCVLYKSENSRGVERLINVLIEAQMNYCSDLIFITYL